MAIKADRHHGRDGSGSSEVAAAAQLLHDFNIQHEEPAPPPHDLAARLTELIGADHVTVLGVAVMRLQPSEWSQAQEVYLAEMYVVPSRRGQGYGRELITETMRVARERGANYALVVTSDEDGLAQRLYEASGFRRTEGGGGPIMLAYEREL